MSVRRPFLVLAALLGAPGCILVPPQQPCLPGGVGTGVVGSPAPGGSPAAGQASPGPAAPGGGAPGGTTPGGGSSPGGTGTGGAGSGGTGGGTTPVATPTPTPTPTATASPLVSAGAAVRVRVTSGRAGDPRTVTLTAATDALQLSATATDADGRSVAVIGWRVDPGGVFAVDPTGRVTIVAPPALGVTARATIRAIGAGGAVSADEDAIVIELVGL